jgi:hypothetical protein
MLTHGKLARVPGGPTPYRTVSVLNRTDRASQSLNGKAAVLWSRPEHCHARRAGASNFPDLLRVHGLWLQSVCSSRFLTAGVLGFSVNIPMFQCSNVSAFRRSNVQTIQHANIPRSHATHTSCATILSHGHPPKRYHAKAYRTKNPDRIGCNNPGPSRCRLLLLATPAPRSDGTIRARGFSRIHRSR